MANPFDTIVGNTKSITHSYGGMTGFDPHYASGYTPPASSQPPPTVGKPTNSWLRLAQVGSSKVQALTNIASKGAGIVGRGLFGGTEKAINTVAAGAVGAAGLAKATTAAITHNPVAEKNAVQGAYKNENKFLAQGKGLGGQGGGFKSAQEASNVSAANLAKKTVGGGLQVASEVVPAVRVGKAAEAGRFLAQGEKAAAKTVSERLLPKGKEVLKQAAGGVASAGASETGSQLAENGKLNAKSILKSAVGGGVIGAATPFVGKLLGTFKEGAQGTLSKLKEGKSVEASLPNLSDEEANRIIPKKIDVSQQTSTIRGKVNQSIPSTKTENPSIQKSIPYNDTDFRLQFNRGSKEAVKSIPGISNTFLKSGTKDPTSLLVEHLSSTSNKSEIRAAVDKLIPNIENTDKNRLVKDIAKTQDGDRVKGLLYDQAKNTELKSSSNIQAISPGKRITFNTPEDATYTKNFNKLGDSYKASMASAKILPAEQRSAALEKVETAHQQALDSLNKDYTSGKMGKTTYKSDTAMAETMDKVPELSISAELPKEEKAASLSSTPPRTDGIKERGFVETVRNSSKTAEGTKKELENAAGYVPQGNDALVKEADSLVKSDITKAHNVAENEVSNKGVATAVSLIQHHQEQGNFAAAADVAEKVAKNLTEAGRTVQAASLYGKLTPEGIVQYASKKVEEQGKNLSPDAKENLQKMAMDIKGMPDSEAKQKATQDMLDYIGKQRGSSLGDKVVSLWKTGLLTAPTTTGGNIVSNVAEAVLRKGFVDPVASGFDTLMSTVTGKKTKTFTFKGLFGGANEGTAKGIQYFKTGYDPLNDPSKFDSKEIHFGDSAAGKVAEKYTQTVMRLMNAQDKPFYYAALRNSLHDQALALAINKDLSGEAKDSFVKEFVTAPSTKAMKTANDEAKYAVFQNKTALGKMAASMKRQGGPIAEAIIPFAQVPSSIATRIIERTPIGAANEIVRQFKNKSFDQRAMSQALANASVGATVMGAGAALMKAGNLTLGYPTDPSEQKQWQLEGRQPLSVKIGDKWYSLNYVQPLGTLLAMGGQYRDAVQGGSSPTKAFESTVAMAGKALSSQSFLQGVSGTINAIQQPERYGAKLAEQTAGSVVPNFIRSAAKATDPSQRAVNNPKEAIQAGLPGQREKLNPTKDVAGNVIPRQSDTLNSFLNPLKPSSERQSKLASALKEVNYTPGSVEKKQRGIVLNDKVLASVQDRTSQLFNDKVNRAVTDSRYQQMTTDRKQATLKTAYSDAKTQALDEVMGKAPKQRSQRALHFK